VLGLSVIDVCPNTPCMSDMLNDFFASISTVVPVDPGVYHSGALHSSSDISKYEIERKLRYIKRTSTGWDSLPSWLFRKCSVEITPVVTHLVNFSINLGQIPGVLL